MMNPIHFQGDTEMRTVIRGAGGGGGMGRFGSSASAIELRLIASLDCRDLPRCCSYCSIIRRSSYAARRACVV